MTNTTTQQGNVTFERSTLEEVVRRQVVLTDDLRSLMDKYGPDTPVVAARRYTPFGTYLLNVQVL